MIKILEKLLNLIYIKVCYFCGSQKEDSLLCSKCRSKIHFLPQGVYKNIQGIDIYAASLYDGINKELIKAVKYKGQKQLASVMADLMFDYWKKLKVCDSEFIVLPVPIHKYRRKERGYNHMDIVAKEFCALSKYRYNTDFLIRIKDTKKQYNLNKHERLENIKDAFDLNVKNIPDKSDNLLIIDDITSTGITLSEIIKVLKKNGYINITALTLATPDIWNK